MRAIALKGFGAEEVMHVAEVPEPQMRPGDLLVRVGAAGVNRTDLLQRAGFYGKQSSDDSPLLGQEIAGEVVAVGEAVTDVSTGDRVMGIVDGGAYAQFARIDRRMAVRCPDGLSFVEAAAIPWSFIIACEALSHLTRVDAQSSVLVHAATSGDGSAFVQMARALGAQVFATAAGNFKSGIVELGADVVFDERTDDFETAVHQHSAEQGVDVVINFVGGDFLARNLRALRAGGSIVQVGLMSGQPSASVPLELLLHRHLRLIGTGLRFRSAVDRRAMVHRFGEVVVPMLEGGRVRPVVDAVFPLEEAADAHRRMQHGVGLGKVVLEIE